MSLRYLSVCSGIEAATVAWHPLGWRAVAYSEIEPFACALLAHHYPSTPNWGDMTKFRSWPDAAIDVLVGGTPCQSFSVAGLRAGMADPRGNLALVYLAIAARYRPRWVVWENVPGVLSSNDGRDFGSILGAMGHLGYGFAYRVLDAQYFKLAQRRARVFVVAYLGDWRPAAAVLFEPSSLRGDPAPRRTQGQETAATIAASTGHHGRSSPRGDGSDNLIAGALAFGGNNTSGPIDVATCRTAHTGAHGSQDFARETFLAFNARQDPDISGDVSHPCGAKDTGHALLAEGTSLVRRLTPRECERLQGFPDDYTAIPYHGRNKEPARDGNRYRAIGNSMAVPVVRWIGERIAQQHAQIHQL